MSFQNVGIIGAGSWGTALGLLLQRNGHAVTLWGHAPAHLEEMRKTRTNAAYLPGIELPADWNYTSELDELAGCDLILVVTPSKAVLLSCTKGVERGSGLRMSQVLAEFFPRHTVAALSGPSHAEEVAQEAPTAVVLGCEDRAVGGRLLAAFATRRFRPYTHEDLAGVELGGALKNIFALAAGITDGLKLGDNAKAALVTRSLAELVRVGTALGGRAETFYGLSGLGDLMVTCFSRHSRNRLVGERLGRGEKIGEIMASMQMIAEGVPTTYSAYECARKFGLETPIIDQVRAILEGEVAPLEALGALMTREPKAEY